MGRDAGVRAASARRAGNPSREYPRPGLHLASNCGLSVIVTGSGADAPMTNGSNNAAPRATCRFISRLSNIPMTRVGSWRDPEIGVGESGEQYLHALGT